MALPISPSSTPTIEEKLAKLCVRPHLSSDVLPRFVLIMLECALHSFLCSFAACVMELIEKYRRGELEPWPEEAVRNEQLRSHHQANRHPTAPRRPAGATHAPRAAASSAEADWVVNPALSRAGWRGASLTAVLPGIGKCGARQGGRLSMNGARFGPLDRCQSALFCTAAGMRRESCV